MLKFFSIMKQQFSKKLSVIYCLPITALLFPISFLSLRCKQLKYVEYDSNGYCSVVPDDPYFGSSWHIQKIEADKAWEISTGLDSTSIGIVDSGINNIYPFILSDLSSNLDLNESIDLSYDVNGSPFYDYLSASEDGCHGTRVASIIGAKGNDETGMAGICWDINMISIRSSGETSGIHFEDIASIFDSNSQNYRGNLPLMNMSIGQRLPNTTYYGTYHCDDLYDGISLYNGLVVVAAGNSATVEHQNLDSSSNHLFYPACFDLDNIIVVGSSNEMDNKWSNSNYGQETVDLFAPGENINSHIFLSNDNGNTITYGGVTGFSGTSAAAPLVAGTAALMLSVNPNLTTAELKSLIMNNVDHVSSLADYCVSGGRLNTYKAVKAAIPQITTLNSFVDGIQLLPAGKHQFYKLSLTPGTYTFETSGNLYTSGYLYHDIQSSPIASSINQNGNFSFEYTCFNNLTVYLKVVNNSLATGNYDIKVTKTGNAHSHQYNESYMYYNGRKHRAFCSCGTYTLQGHAVTGNSNICIRCGGFVDMGFIGPLSIYTNVGNDSKIFPDGLLILGNIDYNLYLSGELDIDSLMGGEII